MFKVADLIAEIFLGSFLVLLAVFLAVKPSLLQSGNAINLFSLLNMTMLSIISALFSKSYPDYLKQDEFQKDIVALVYVGFTTTILLFGVLLDDTLLQNNYVWGQLLSDITSLIYIVTGISGTDYKTNDKASPP